MYIYIYILDELEVAINKVVNEDIGIEKSSLGIRNQKCYAVKVYILDVFPYIGRGIYLFW